MPTRGSHDTSRFRRGTATLAQVIYDNDRLYRLSGEGSGPRDARGPHDWRRLVTRETYSAVGHRSSVITCWFLVNWCFKLVEECQIWAISVGGPSSLKKCGAVSAVAGESGRMARNWLRFVSRTTRTRKQARWQQVDGITQVRYITGDKNTVGAGPLVSRWWPSRTAACCRGLSVSARCCTNSYRQQRHSRHVFPSNLVSKDSVLPF
ncbi:hypothetical protein J6590_033175 [Homalodisca vitripennis]|nr:hypothetical protein J6590_033175 [Homalodisca vitripennis]